jgi:hypothetical protein
MFFPTVLLIAKASQPGPVRAMCMCKPEDLLQQEGIVVQQDGHG